MNKIKHLLGISGGKDSAALAIFMQDKMPNIDVEYYTCDTGRELDDTYKLIERLEVYLGKNILKLTTVDSIEEIPFDYFLKVNGNYLPSSSARWCTGKLKLEPFEKHIGDDQVISYVGIRGDEDREGYISKKETIQSIFPFRKCIWSEDVVKAVLQNLNISLLNEYANELVDKEKLTSFKEILDKRLNLHFSQRQKLNTLLDLCVVSFNKLVFKYLKEKTDYPVGKLDEFPLIYNKDVIVRADVFKMLEESGVGVPNYYKEIEFEHNGEKATYSRSRSGCFFCFFQQKIEWVWLYEQHNDLFLKAMEYEKDGYNWIQDEPLTDLIKPSRIDQIKTNYIKRYKKLKANNNSNKLSDILLDESEGVGCASCFI